MVIHNRTFAGYALGDPLGSGSLGVVYRATARDGALVAIKILREELGADDIFRRRFAHEARVAREVRHRHLVPVLEAGEDDGRPYVVTPFVGGGSLDQRLADGPLPVHDLARTVAHVAAGLDALHRAGLVHRDVKPANVMLDERGAAALTDFGLAKGPAYTRLTRPGQVLGTLDYLAPEIIRGAEGGSAADVYALGCLAYACATGAPPFSGHDLLAVGSAHLFDEPPLPPLPPPAADALLRALAKDPGERPPTAAAYAHLLAAAMRGR